MMSKIKFLPAFLILVLYLIGCAKDEKQLDNHAPIANAGNDTTISLPANTATLNASLSTDSDNNIKAYQWTKISGPTCNIVDANAVQTQVTNLTAGVYVFELKVTDASDVFDKDTMQVTVINATVNVYVAGAELNSGKRFAKYWKNGVAVNLSDGKFDASAYAIAVVNNDVYVSGVENNSSGKQVAKYWKNGVAVNLTDGSGWAFGNDIVVINNDVYVAGFEDKFGAVVAKYWKNGVAVNLTNGSNAARAKSITVVNNDVYVAGYELNSSGKDVAKYWKNGVAVNLTDGSTNMNAVDITVVNNDVYVVGYEFENGKQVAKYWKNGVAINLTDGINISVAWAVAVQ